MGRNVTKISFRQQGKNQYPPPENAEHAGSFVPHKLLAVKAKSEREKQQ